MIAGQCHCKTYVDGQRCDRCKNGYWNFTAENPDGCQGIYDGKVYETKFNYILFLM